MILRSSNPYSPTVPNSKTQRPPFKWTSAIVAGGLLAVSCPQPTFGCRLEAVMEPQQTSTPAVQQAEDQWLWSSLVTGSNSLQKQSRPGLPENGSLQDPFNIEDLSGALRQYGNPDGWGIVNYTLVQPHIHPASQSVLHPTHGEAGVLCGTQPDDACSVQSSSQPNMQPNNPSNKQAVAQSGNQTEKLSVSKNILPAYSDPKFPIAVGQAISQKPNIFMAHIRLASPEYKNIELDNVHPFIYRNWSFMHNGSLNGAFSPVIDAKINQYRPMLGAGPQGITDSEHAFYYFLSKLYETTGTTDSQNIPVEVLQKVFAESIQDLLHASSHPAKHLNGQLMGIGGDIEIQPACNFIVSDGSHLFVFKKTLSLYLGEKTLPNQQKAYMVSSEKTYLPDPSVQWLEIPDGHLLTLSWDSEGNPQAVMEPLTKY